MSQVSKLKVKTAHISLNSYSTAVTYKPTTYDVSCFAPQINATVKFLTIHSRPQYCSQQQEPDGIYEFNIKFPKNPFKKVIQIPKYYNRIIYINHILWDKQTICIISLTNILSCNPGLSVIYNSDTVLSCDFIFTFVSFYIRFTHFLSSFAAKLN